MEIIKIFPRVLSMAKASLGDKALGKALMGNLSLHKKWHIFIIRCSEFIFSWHVVEALSHALKRKLKRQTFPHVGFHIKIFHQKNKTVKRMHWKLDFIS